MDSAFVTWLWSFPNLSRLDQLVLLYLGTDVREGSCSSSVDMDCLTRQFSASETVIRASLRRLVAGGILSFETYQNGEEWVTEEHVAWFAYTPSPSPVSDRPRSLSPWTKKRYAVFDRDGWACQKCGLQFAHGQETCKNRRLTVDHIVPRARGGTHALDNLRPLCDVCNSSKGVW